MATSAGMGFDLSDVLQDARAADHVLEKMVDRSAELSRNMQHAFSVGGSNGMRQYIAQLQEMQRLLGGMTSNTLRIDVDSKRVTELNDALGRIAQTVNVLTQGSNGIALFDTQGIYASTKGVLELSQALSTINEEINKIKSEWATIQWAKTVDLDTIDDAEKRVATETLRNNAQVYEADLESRLRIEVEKKAIAQRELQYANMTEDQKAAYVKQKMEEILRAEQANINSIRSEYTKLLSQLASLDSQISRYEKAEQSGKSLGAGGEDALLELQVSREQVQNRLTQMYSEHQNVLADIAEKGAIRRAEIISSIEGRAYTKTEALALANKATSSTGTGRDLQEALRALESAKMGDTMIGDAQSLKELNDAIIRVKGSLEKLQEVEHKENSIQPSLRNEYSRTIAEIEKLEGLKRDLLTAEGKEAALTGDTTLHIRENKAIIARLEELYEKRRTLEEQAHGLFVEQQRKHETERTAVAIQEYQKRINKLEEYQKKYGTVTSAYANSIATGVQDAPNVRQAQLAIEKLSEIRARLNKNDANYQQTLERLNSEIKRHEDYIQSVTNAEKHRLEIEKRNATKDASNALAYSKQAKSLNDIQKAIKYLDEARRKEDQSTKRGRANYQQLTAEMNRQQKKYNELTQSIDRYGSSMLNIGQQIQRATALMFSVSAIRGYINQLIQVRGEFEMMNRSLQVLLQNKDDADKLWDKTVQLAVKSPFTVRQLVTYTKQLAAYRVESDKLYETNRRLADISAGLGVDMNRLILAYGQVKAANYLRGTELRQFSEAGLNMLGELADRFTQLEGRVVSVGDVFQLVSKRLVSFEDVDAVIKSLTDRGGLFYKMQEEQSETLRGQIMNLRDSLDLMFNDIGEANDGVLKNGVAIVRELVNNWKSFKEFFTSIPVVIMAAVTAMNKFGASAMATRLGGALLPTKFLQWFDNKQLDQMIKAEMALKKTGVAAKASGVAATVGAKGFALLKNAMLALSSVGIMAAITAVIYGLYKLWDWATKASRMAERLNESLAAIGKESLQGLNDTLATFSQLTDTLTDSTKSYTEHQDALAELRRTYKDILPAHKLTEEYIVSLKGNYDELTASIIKYYQAREYEKKYQAVLDSDYMKDLQEEMEEVYTEANKDGAFGMIFPERQVKEWAQTVATELATGELPRTLDALRERTQEIFGENTKIDQMRFGGVIKDADMLAQKMGEISLATIGAKNAQEAYARSLRQDENANRGREQELLEQIEKQKSIIKSREDSLAALSRNQYAPRSQVEEAGNRYAEEVAELERLKLQLDDVYAARAELIAQNFKEEVEAEIKTLTVEIEKWWDNEQVLKSLERQGKKNTAQYETFRKEQDKIVASANQMAEEFGTEVPWAMIEAQETTHDLGKVLKTVATNAFPTVAQKAIEAMSKTQEAFLVAKGGVLSFVDTLIKILPTDWAEKLPDVGAMLAENDKQLAALRGELNEVTAEAEEAGVSIADIYSDRAKANVEKFGADMNAVNKVLKKGADTPRQMAEKLRNDAQELTEMYTAYSTSTNKSVWLEANQETEESMALMEKNIKAMEALAKELWGEDKKGGKGGGDKDPWIQIFTQRSKAVQDFYNKYETVRKKFNEEESQTRTKDSFADYFKGVGLDMQKVIDEGWDTQALVANLEELEKQIKEHYGSIYDEAQKIMASGSTIDAIVNPTERQRMTYALAKLLADIQKDIADNKIKIDFELQENAREQLNKDFEELFDRYDLTKELKELGFTDELALAFGFETLDLDGVRKEITDLYNKVSTENPKLGKKAEDDFKKSLKRITALENKSMEERMKTYSKYLLQGYSEAVKIKLEEARQLREIDELEAHARKKLNRELTAEEKGEFDMMRQAVKDESLKAYEKQKWKDFKNSDLYTMMFNDLEYYGSEALNVLKEKIESLKDELSHLDAPAVKDIISQINKIDDVIMMRTPGKWLKSIRSEMETRGVKSEAEETEGLVKAMAAEAEAQAIIDVIHLKQQSKALSEEEQALYNANVSYVGDIAKNQQDVLSNKQLEVRNAQKTQETHQKNLDLISDEEQAEIGKLEKANEYLAAVKKGLEAGKELLSALGVEEDSVASALVDAGISMVSLTMSAIQFQIQLKEMGKAAKSALGIIGWTAIAIQAVATAIEAIFFAKDKRLQKRIEAWQDKVEDLQRSFEKLEEAIDNSFNMSQYEEDFDAAQENLQAQINARKQMIAAEDAKKKTDHDQINKWKEENEEDLEKMQELEEKRTEAFGGFGSDENYKSAAESFVDAWLEAYKETGDGLSGLQDQFDEFLENLVKKQIVMKLSEALLKPIMTQIDEAVEKGSAGDGTVTQAEMQRIISDTEARLPEINKALKDYLESIGGLEAIGQGTGSLSELEKGITSISEESAQVLSALLSSIRLYVATSTEYARDQLTYTKKIFTLFDNMTAAHPSGSRGLKVVI